MAIAMNSFRSNGILSVTFGNRTNYEGEVREEREVIWLQFASQDKLNEFTVRNEIIFPYLSSHPDEIRQNILAIVGRLENSRQSLINIVNSALLSQR